MKNVNFHKATKKLKSEGKLRFIGASNHGARFGSTEDMMQKILLSAVDDGRFDLILLVYNFLKTDPGEKIITACKKKNIAVTVMKSNPVGRFYETKERIDKMKKEGLKISPRMSAYYSELEKTARDAESLIKKNNLKSSNEIRDAGIKFILSIKGVDVLKFAFRSFNDVENILKLSGNLLSKNNIEVLNNYARGPAALYCRHACGICESSCPKDVPVNTVMRYNHYFETGGSEKYAMEKYSGLNTNKPDICDNSSAPCESSCPYGLPVKSMLQEADLTLRLT